MVTITNFMIGFFVDEPFNPDEFVTNPETSAK